MTGYIGQFLLILAGLNAILGIIGRWRWASLHTTTALILAGFLWLIYGHVTDDFSLINVFLHSHTDKPLLYKIAGAWGNHEGSFLLWLTLLALCISVAHYHHRNEIFETLGQVTLVSFLGFVLGCSDPFTQHLIVPEQGRDLNPLLQDPLLAIHPPCLYLGYVSFAIPFLWSLAGVLSGNIPLNRIRQWSLWGWTFLTMGIALGSFWAYYELGWGGWWAWDPVENAALIPWLCATAQIHILWLAQRRSDYIKTALVILCVTWASCLGGTIVVRSGLLTSVHTFAVAPERGILLTLISSALMISGIWILKAYLTPQPSDTPKTKLFVLMEAGCGILLVGWFTVLLGTLYPLISEVFGLPITVGTPYFQLTFVPLMLPLLVLMALLPEIISPYPSLPMGFIMGGFAFVTSYWILEITHILSLLTIGLSAWLLVASWQALIQRRSLKPVDLGHMGLALTLLGMALTLNLSQDLLTVLKPNQPVSFASYTMELKSVTPVEGPNYTAHQAWLEIRQKGQLITTLKPEKRLYHAQQMIHGETALYSHGWDHLYAVLGDTYQDQQWSIRLYVKPWINIMVLGVVLMIMGGGMALLRRSRTNLQTATAATLFILWFTQSGMALEAHEQLADPRLETIAHDLGSLLLCPTCAGQALNDSPSTMAQDLRRHIRQELVLGKSRQDIIEDFQHRFGPQVYRHPPVQGGTIALWGLPWLALIGVGYGIYRRQKIIG